MNFTKSVKSHFVEVRVGGIWGKKHTVSIMVYGDRIEGSAFIWYGKDLIYTDFTVPFENIVDTVVEDVEKKSCFVIVCKDLNNTPLSHSTISRLAFVGFEDLNGWVEFVDRARSTRLAELQVKEERELEERQKQIEYERKAELDAQKFFNECFAFHINQDTPVYSVMSETNKFNGIYVGKDKSLNFLMIDGYAKEEINGWIPYDKIHYYHKAGSVSYTTDIHGKYSSFGGSFAGGRFSKPAAAVGGILFGTAGMMAGAMLTYRPSEHELPKTEFVIDSEVVKIDDRNIILNFYSDEKQQYIDIELPQEMFNFLQTHLPEKKYSIVEEIERKMATQKMQQLSEGQSSVQSISLSRLPSEQNDSMEQFKNKVEKLKMMKEAGLLTDEEYNAERVKLLSQI